MSKYYVECGNKRIVLLARDAREAAVRAVERWWSFGYELMLGTGVSVHETSFSARVTPAAEDGERFATYDLVAELEGRPVEDLVEAVLAGIRGA